MAADSADSAESRGWCVIAAGALVAITTASAAAQSPSAVAGRRDLVTVDFAALTAEGAPVPDLNAGELQLKIDGKARAITSLRWIAPPSAGVSYLFVFGSCAA